MRKFSIFICLTILGCNVFSQWYKQGLLPHGDGWGNYYYDLKFVNSDTGFVASFGYVNSGFNGFIFKTTDAGTTWNQIFQTKTYPLYSIFILNQDTILIAGEDSCLRTTNGGNTWLVKRNGSGNSIISIVFINSKVGFRVGRSFPNDGDPKATLQKTIDGGNIWMFNYSMYVNSFYDICFPDSSTGYAVGASGSIIKTTNCGTNWNILTSNTTATLRSVKFLDANTGFVTSKNGAILKTTDGGNNWITFQYDTVSYLRDIFFTSNDVGYVVGSKGLILKTINCGSDWVRQESNTTQYLISVDFTDFNTGYILSDSGLVLKTTNGGNSIVNISNNNCVNNLSYPNPFNNTTAIKYCQKEKCLVTVTVYDFSGCIVETLINKVLASGDYEFNFNGAKHSSGVYFYSIKTDKHVYSGKMVLCK